MQTPGLNRLSYIDALKALSAFMIVLLHVSAVYVDLTVAPTGKFLYFLNSIVRPALPIFMMVSGTLLLRDQYRFSFSKKFLYIAKIYIFWSAFYVAFEQIAFYLNGSALLSPEEMLVHWIRGPYHFWYLAMLMGIYIFMPVLNRIKDFQTLNYLVGLSFVLLYVLPFVQPYLPQCVNDFVSQMMVYQANYNLFFFLLGAWLNALPLDKALMKAASTLFAVGVVLTIFQLHIAAHYSDMLAASPLKSYSQLFIAMGIFYMVRYAFRNHRSSERLMLISKCTLHIYIISAFVIYLFQYLIQEHWDALVPQPGISSLIWSVIVYIGSFAIGYLVYRKDRWLRRHRREKANN